MASIVEINYGGKCGAFIKGPSVVVVVMSESPTMLCSSVPPTLPFPSSYVSVTYYYQLYLVREAEAEAA
jgi:hypothetical protein